MYSTMIVPPVSEVNTARDCVQRLYLSGLTNVVTGKVLEYIFFIGIMTEW